NGQMATAFIDLNGAYYYLNPYSEENQGAMKVGWQKINGYWYYFNPVSDSYGYEGMMAKSGWRCIGGVWYYFWSDGTMAANTRVNGYYVNSSGAWVPGV
ncbi:MAG: PspC family transcriptional regulator, partial [Clostridium sp.]